MGLKGEIKVKFEKQVELRRGGRKRRKERRKRKYAIAIKPWYARGGKRIERLIIMVREVKG